MDLHLVSSSLSLAEPLTNDDIEFPWEHLRPVASGETLVQANAATLWSQRCTLAICFTEFARALSVL
jgi:hypothetical protein